MTHFYDIIAIDSIKVIYDIYHQALSSSKEIRMGRPFVSELEAISETSRMFFEYNVDRLYDSVKCSLNIPVLAIGSGGSSQSRKRFRC